MLPAAGYRRDGRFRNVYRLAGPPALFSDRLRLPGGVRVARVAFSVLAVPVVLEVFVLVFPVLPRTMLGSVSWLARETSTCADWWKA